jgi:choline kinase
VADKDKANLIAGLAACEDGDYFERGIEITIEKNSTEFIPIDISDLYAVEVDFEEDLTRANSHL